MLKKNANDYRLNFRRDLAGKALGDQERVQEIIWAPPLEGSFVLVELPS
jgi:hypothetical protein